MKIENIIYYKESFVTKKEVGFFVKIYVCDLDALREIKEKSFILVFFLYLYLNGFYYSIQATQFNQLLENVFSEFSF